MACSQRLTALLVSSSQLCLHAGTGKNYEEEFATEIEKGRTGQVKNTPWGSSYAKTPKILHGERTAVCQQLHLAYRHRTARPSLHVSSVAGHAGYDREVKGVTAEERLDIRVAQRSDKFCR